MLSALCGSKTIQKVLLFLFVNGKCYGTELHHLLNTPLTPIQKALQRLEKGGIILSDYEGKTRLYRFNPAFPLLAELEQLLKKAYTMLPPHEKKPYTLIKLPNHNKNSKQVPPAGIVRAFWERLSNVKQVSFTAKTKSKSMEGWQGRGKGEVIVTKEHENALIFQEKGTWQGDDGRDIGFSNVFRWTLDLANGMISLEHLRRGWNHPVFLFHLSPSNHQTLSSIDSHLCGGDVYLGKVFYELHSLRLHWRVIGPKKNEELDYYYT